MEPPEDVPELIWSYPGYKPRSKLRKFLQSLLLAFVIVVVTIGIVIAVAEYGSNDNTNGGGSAQPSGTAFQGLVSKG
jgi:hypothetical protein